MWNFHKCDDDEFISQNVFQFNDLEIRVRKFYLTTCIGYPNGFYYFMPTIILSKGCNISSITGGYKSEKEALEDAKEYIIEHNLKK